MKGIIFVVDSADDMRMFEVGGLIKQLLSEDLLRNLPLLVYANKQDLNVRRPVPFPPPSKVRAPQCVT